MFRYLDSLGTELKALVLRKYRLGAITWALSEYILQCVSATSFYFTTDNIVAIISTVNFSITQVVPFLHVKYSSMLHSKDISFRLSNPLEGVSVSEEVLGQTDAICFSS